MMTDLFTHGYALLIEDFPVALFDSLSTL